MARKVERYGRGKVVKKLSVTADAKPFLPLKTFLVPIDFSARSRLAVQYAGGLAKKTGATVELLFVVDPVCPGLERAPLSADNTQMADVARGLLRALATTLLPAGVESCISVRHGKVVAAIEDYARERAVDLIIIPTHGYSGIKRLLVGSTAELIVRHAPCPVLTLRLNTRAGGIGSAPQLNRILAPVDFSKPSANSLLVAAALAERLRARLTVLHVTFSAPPPARLAAFSRLQGRKAVEHAASSFVREQLGERPAPMIEVVAGLPQKEITRAAAALKSDLIVIATHGRTGLRRWLMGSTAEQVIRHACCPVLVIRQLVSYPRPTEPKTRPQERPRPWKTARSALPHRSPRGWHMKEGRIV